MVFQKLLLMFELNLCEWKQLLLCLDEESRKIVELYYFDEFSVKEISALLEMNSNTVSTKLSRARAKLKKELLLQLVLLLLLRILQIRIILMEKRIESIKKKMENGRKYQE